MRFSTTSSTILASLALTTTTTTTTTTNAFVILARPSRQDATRALHVASLDPLDDDLWFASSSSFLTTDHGNHHNNDKEPNGSNNNNNNNNMVAQLPLLALQLVAVLGIKAVKDLVHYPPCWIMQQAMFFWEGKRSSAQGDKAANILNPPVLAIKLVLVLLLKTVHDGVYYPAVWTQRWVTCQSLDECPIVGE